MKRWMGAAALISAAMWSGCNAPPVERQAEVTRFHEEMATRTAALDLKTGDVLSMTRCEEIALANSLQLSVARQNFRLQDSTVKLALSGYFPTAELMYQNQIRSNESMISQGGFVMQTEKPHQQFLVISAMLPVLDFGVTYYGWKIAQDQRTQEALVLQRTQQTLRRDVRVAYARHASELRQLELRATNVKAAEEVLRVALALQREGLATSAETAIVRATLAQAQVDLSKAQQRVEETRQNLRQLMSLPPGTPLAINEILPAMPAPPDAQAMVEYEDHALRVRPELHGQDLMRHMAANLVRQQIAGAFPRLNAIGSFNWSNNAFVVNPAYFLGGFQVAQSLLDLPTRYLRVQQGRIGQDVEKERALLLAMGVLYEVDLRGIQLQLGHETIKSIEAQEAARREAFNRVMSLYQEGLESEAATAQALAELSMQAAELDRARTDYQVWWYEFESAVLPEASLAATPLSGTPRVSANDQAAAIVK